jgi:O-antigen ligase
MLLSVLTAVTMFIYYAPGEFAGGMRSDVGKQLDYGRKISGNQYLMGIDNVSFFYIFTILIIFCVYELIYRKKLSKLFYGTYFFIAAAFVYVRSATAPLCFAVGAVVIILVANKEFFLRHFAFINYRIGLLAVLAFFVLIVCLRRQDIFEFLIVGVFGKNLTLTRRTAIWDTAISEIIKRPLFGVGLQSDSYNFALFKVNHVHNIVMELLYEGGIVALFLFLYGMIGYCREIIHVHNKKILIILSGGVIVYLLCTCLDFYPHIFLPYSLFLLCENADLLIRERNNSCVQEIV